MHSILITEVLFFFIISIVAAQQANEADSYVIAKNNGTLRIGFTQIQNGIYSDKDNFFFATLYPDNVSNKLGKYIFYEVIMGEFHDYLIPAVQSDNGKPTLYGPHDVLVDGVRLDMQTLDYTYTETSPLNVSFDGFSSIVRNGGRVDVFVPQGNRNVPTKWKGNGGCCFINPKDKYGNGKPYTIVIHRLPINYTYLRVINAPMFYYFGQKTGIKAVVADIFGRSDIPEVKCDWSVKRSDLFSSVVSNGSFVSLELPPVTEYKGFSLTLNASLTSPGDKSFWKPKGALYSTLFFNLLQPYDIVGNSSYLDYNSPVTRMLRYTDPKNVIEVMKGDYIDADTSFFKPINDDNLFPRNGQVMHATNVDAVNDGTTPTQYEWVWTNVSSSNGLFGGGAVESNTYQYFAFAFHNPIEQLISIITMCPEDLYCFIYINGSSPNDNIQYRIGWYQVIVKIGSENPIPVDEGFKILFEASGLAINDAIMDNAPYKKHTEASTTPTPVKSTTLSPSGNSTSASMITTSIAPTNSTTSLSSTATSPAHVSDDSKKGKTTGIIVGCIVGVIVLIGLIVLTIFLLRRRAHAKNEKIIPAA